MYKVTIKFFPMKSGHSFPNLGHTECIFLKIYVFLQEICSSVNLMWTGAVNALSDPNLPVALAECGGVKQSVAEQRDRGLCRAEWINVKSYTSTSLSTSVRFHCRCCICSPCIGNFLPYD